MITLDAFETRLADYMKDQPALRPFVCEGSPLACKAFIVGFNPATEMTAEFKRFWHAGHGFDKAAWFARYKEERQHRPLPPGKKVRSAVSNSRRVIEWIIDAASPISILETNIYAVPTQREVDLPALQRQTDLFDFLMEAVKPGVVVAHGKKAEEHLKSKTLPAQLITVSHFSRGWSEVRARDLGVRIKLACDSKR